MSDEPQEESELRLIPVNAASTCVTYTYDISDEELRQRREEREQRRTGARIAGGVTTYVYTPDGPVIQPSPEA